MTQAQVSPEMRDDATKFLGRLSNESGGDVVRVFRDQGLDFGIENVYLLGREGHLALAIG